MRFLFYSHDGLGLGHTRRHIAVASALLEMAPTASVLLATGADDMSRIGLPPHIEVLKLPGLRKITNETYGSRRLRISPGDIRSMRSSLLTAAAKSYAPDVTLVDKHPFGAKGEFRDALEVIRASGGRAVLGLRDVLDTPETVAQEWGTHGLLNLISAFYDQVLVYGEESIFDPVSAYQFPTQIAERTRFCGYVVNREAPADPFETTLGKLGLEDRTRPIVLATTGGGEDGFFLLETFMRAAAGAPWQAIVIAGPMAPEPQYETLKALASENNILLLPFVPRLSSLFWNIDALVCMGGYNTLAEAISKGMPVVCVPRKVPRAEQHIRASAFQQRGLLQLIAPDELNAQILREEIAKAIKVPRQKLLERVRSVLSFDGSRQAATQLLTLATESVGYDRATAPLVN